MAFTDHQNKIYESLRDLLDIQPTCDYILSVSPFTHQTKANGKYMGVTTRLMVHLMGTIYITEDRRQFLGAKAQAVQNRSMVIGTLYDEREEQKGTGHFILMLIDNGVVTEHKLAWNNHDSDAHVAAEIMFKFINTEWQTTFKTASSGRW